MLPSQRPKFSEPIEYAPATDAQRRRVRMNRITRWMLMAALSSVALAWGWRLTLQLQYLYWQHQCMTWSLKPDAVIYDGTKKVLPKFVEHALPDQIFGACAFMHERRSKRGEVRLVVVTLESASPPTFFLARSYAPATIRPKSVLADEQSTSTTLSDNPRIIVRAGQIDANDASHFTIDTTDGNTQQMYDGWLRDDGSVIIEPRRK